MQHGALDDRFDVLDQVARSLDPHERVAVGALRADDADRHVEVPVEGEAVGRAQDALLLDDLARAAHDDAPVGAARSAEHERRRERVRDAS